MKNQYFGDINDYRKYGLLRILAGDTKMRTAICWMLTPDDQRTDGGFVDYLNNPQRWRKHDPHLFDSLSNCIRHKKKRSVQWAEANNLIPSAVYFSKMLSYDREDRSKYFRELHEVIAGCDLAFFDPDNGIEVRSVPYGRKHSPENTYIGMSLLILSSPGNLS